MLRTGRIACPPPFTSLCGILNGRMPTRPNLESARQRLFRALARSQESLAERAIVREPLSEAQQRSAARRVAELGLAEKADRLRRT